MEAESSKLQMSLLRNLKWPFWSFGTCYYRQQTIKLLQYQTKPMLSSSLLYYYHQLIQINKIKKYLQQIYQIMKLLVVICLLTFSCLSINILDSIYSPFLGFTKKVTKFGDVLYHRNQSDVEEAILTSYDNWQSPQVYSAALNTILDVAQNPQRKKQFLACSKGKHSQFFKFGAAHVGYIGNKSEHQSIVLQRRDDDCFDKVTVNFTRSSVNNINSVTLQLLAEGKRHKEFCTESYIIGTAAKVHIHTFALRRHHKFTWKNMDDLHYNNVITWGIHIFRHCDSIKHWFPDVIKTAELFVGGLGLNPKIPFLGSKPPKYMQDLNVDFIEAGTGYRWKDRKPVAVNLTSYEVKSGDFLAITRFDGVDQIIEFGSGSHAGHTCVILEVDGVMSVVESQDGWYWPKHGIQRNDWETWKKWALNADFNVAVLPLSEQSRKKFDVKKAEAFFKKMEGFPYGYHNFLFGWIDTPKDNYPTVLDPNLVLAGFSYLERLAAYPIDRILTQGLNKRLGVTNKNLAELAVIMDKKGMTFGELMAIPERDGWWYSDGYSYVCSSFVSAVYQAGGLLKDIQGTQFAPRDVYTLNIYDRNYKVPSKCSVNDPSLPYCQIMGSHLMELPGYATIEPYPHMAERCPTVGPDFIRPDGC